VQGHAHGAWNRAGGDFRANLEADPAVTSRLSPQQLADCFSSDRHRVHLPVIYARLGI
jgi:adenylosuccinate lyase